MHRRALVALLAALACGDRRGDAGDARVEPTRLPNDDECAACHPDVAEEWERSRHHTAFTNLDFQRSYAREPLPFCRECHAPEHARLLPDAAEALGVGCLACHRDGDAIVTGTSRDVAAPHGLRRDPAFSTRACARCHEFDFPEESDYPPGTMMQMTMSEHRDSKYADRACADCHMPRAHPGRSRHHFASTRDPDAMRRALEAHARREGDTLVLDLRPREVGHAFPTGDLFRRLAVHAALVTADGRTLAHEVRYLARHFVPRHYPDGRLRQAGNRPPVDDRLRSASTLRIDLSPGDPASELAWWVDLERVDHLDREHPDRSTIASTIRLAEGRLPSQPDAGPRP